VGVFLVKGLMGGGVYVREVIDGGVYGGCAFWLNNFQEIIFSSSSSFILIMLDDSKNLS